MVELSARVEVVKVPLEAEAGAGAGDCDVCGGAMGMKGVINPGTLGTIHGDHPGDRAAFQDCRHIHTKPSTRTAHTRYIGSRILDERPKRKM